MSELKTPALESLIAGVGHAPDHGRTGHPAAWCPRCELDAELQSLRSQLGAAEAEKAELHKAAAQVCKAFDDGLFVRTLKYDGENNWQMRFAPALAALGALTDFAQPNGPASSPPPAEGR